MNTTIIKKETDVSLKQALGIAEKEFMKNEQVEFVYIDGRTVSDLIVNDKGITRSCTHAEWVEFFNKYYKN
jgi:hypothetical protein